MAGMRFQRYRTIPPGDQRLPAEIPDADCGESFWFWCPGCNCPHRYTTKYAKGEIEALAKEGRGHPLWFFNGNMEKPSFTASLLYPGTTDANGKVRERCHLFVTDGEIRYEADCSHGLAGKKAPLQGI